MKMINNWKPEVRSLLASLVKHGCTIVAGSDGEERKPRNKCKTQAEFVKHLTGCDEAWLIVNTPTQDRCTIYLVFGNSPGELPADYTVDPAIEAACEEHGDKWEGRKQPQVPCPYEAKRLRQARLEVPADTIEQLDNDIQAAAENEVNDAHLSTPERAALLARAKILMPEFEQTGNIDTDFCNLIF